jgi:hypothetical protein
MKTSLYIILIKDAIIERNRYFLFVEYSKIIFAFNSKSMSVKNIFRVARHDYYRSLISQL